MQCAGYIRWWNHNAIGIVVLFVDVSTKIALRFPVLVPVLFNKLWVIGFFHGVRHMGVSK